MVYLCFVCAFQPIFTMSAQQNQLKDVTDRDFKSFMNSYRHIPVSRSQSMIKHLVLETPLFSCWVLLRLVQSLYQSALQFLEAYTAEDVTVAELEGSSNSLWTISPPSRKNLMDVLSKEDQFPVTMYWSIQRYSGRFTFRCTMITVFIFVVCKSLLLTIAAFI